MADVMLKLPTRGKTREQEVYDFASELIRIQNQIDFRVSARGWCYQMEQFGLITKAEFDKAQSIVNECRDKGYLAIDFVAEDDARKFSGVEIPEDRTPPEFLKEVLQQSLRCENFYTPDWWDGEEYYIQMVVEKIDLKTLFQPVCQEYHIPIATARGWSSKLQRGTYARRFKQAENMGLECVLLYCGDHDPDGLRISEFMRTNLMDLADIRWEDGVRGYDPRYLKIDRFGLNYDFITANNLTWIDNLITASKKNLASPSHPNYYLSYVQEYLSEYGARKCEANALVVAPGSARDLCRQVIEGYLGVDSLERFQQRWQVIADTMEQLRDETGVGDSIEQAIKAIDNQ